MALRSQKVLTINSGSSSLKLALYEMAKEESLLCSIEVNRIGESTGELRMAGAGRRSRDLQGNFRNHNEALESALHVLKEQGFDGGIDAISHRIVHGGAQYEEPQRITADLIAELQALQPLDPDHLPQALAGIETLGRTHANVPQFACFDTSFHRTMPRVAQLCPLPLKYFDDGVLRYGFHGISYEYIMWELRTLVGGRANGRVIVAHLGNGASMAAIKGGHSLDTTMGFTPTSGLLMGTRSGDIDPGVLLYLLGQEGATAAEINALLNKRSGLLAISGISQDIRDLLVRESASPAATDALALFCYRIKKYIAAYAGVLSGLDILVFTAGIGENAPVIRERACIGLEFLGIELDAARNRANAPVISSASSRAEVRVMKTNENLMLARHAARLLGGT